MRKKIHKNSPVETLQADATNLLAIGNYKEAIDVYKRLLKIEQREQWQTALTKAYLLRAQSLADKGMYKEAAVLWENRANLCNDNEGLDKYIYWLIRADRYILAVHRITESAEYLSDNAIRQLHAQFGALLLAGYSKEAFPQDSILIKQYALIQQALQAYFQGDDQTTEDYLKKIPFRSPYRYFNLIIKALLIIEADPSTANQLLEKVPADSPYAQFAALIQLAVQDGETLLTGLYKLSNNEQRFIAFIASLKGWDKAKLKVIPMLLTAARRCGSHKALLEVVAANRQTLGDNYSRQFCLALLPSYPAGIKYYERTFGALSAFEKNRLIALKHEREKGYFEANHHWRLCIDHLKKHPEPDNVLKAALILRHLVELAERRGESFDDDNIPNDLAESISLDPDDKNSYFKLIQWYKHKNYQNTYHKWVDTAIKQFPQDSEVLLAGMESATEKKAFKKAARFAKTLLKVDPINIKAQQISRLCHISHARKLIKSGKYELARKELNQAAHFEKIRQRSGVVQINQGLLELQAERFIQPKTIRQSRKSKVTAPDLFKLQQAKNLKKVKNTQAIELLQEGLQLAGDGIRGFFRMIVEIKSQNIDPANILPLLPRLNEGYLPTRHEILELISLINGYSEEGINFLTEVLESLKVLLEKAAKIDFSQEEMLSLCECFKKLEHKELLRQFAEHALKRWAEQPAFVFYQIYSQSSQSFSSMLMSDMDRLKEAADKAKEQGDQRTAMMIVGFLNHMMPPIFDPFSDFGNFDDDDD